MCNQQYCSLLCISNTQFHSLLLEATKDRHDNHKSLNRWVMFYCKMTNKCWQQRWALMSNSEFKQHLADFTARLQPLCVWVDFAMRTTCSGNVFIITTNLQASLVNNDSWGRVLQLCLLQLDGHVLKCVCVCSAFLWPDNSHQQKPAEHAVERLWFTHG